MFVPFNIDVIFRIVFAASYSSYEKTDNANPIKEERSSNHSAPINPKSPTEIEQGTDLLSPSADINSTETKTVTINQPPQSHGNGNLSNNFKKQISRSVGSYTDEECSTTRVALELGSDPLINAAGGVELPPSLEDGQEYLRKWLDSGPAMVCSEENLYPEEVMGTTVKEGGSGNGVPLTERTDALLNTKSFNLVKPKYP